MILLRAVLVCALLLPASVSSLSSLSKVLRQGACIATAVAAAPFLDDTAYATEIVKIQVDIPQLIQIAKDNKDVALKLAKQTSEAVSITQLPKNIVDFVRDAASGDVLIEINGVPIDVSVLSEKGAIDFGVSTTKGDIGLTVSSKLLPKIPLLSKRFPPVDLEAILAEEKAAAKAAEIPVTPLLDREVAYGYSLQQVLGFGSIAVGAAYAGSYYYYQQELAEAEAEAETKKKAAAEKKKTAAKKDTPVAKKTPPAPVKGESKKDADVKPVAEEAKPAAVANAMPTPDPFSLRVSTPIETPGEDSTPISSSTDQEDKKKRFKFWK